MSTLEGRHVLVTGASAGIGRACAEQFAARGCRLTLWARRADRLEALREELASEHGVDVRTARVDVRDRDAVSSAVDAMVAEWGAPDVLVNNAGLASGLDRIHEGDFEDWDRMIDTNVRGLLHVTRLVLPHMVERDRGHVINIGSVAGHVVYPKGNVYNATKFAVRALTEAMNVDLVGTNIRVSSVDPGACETEFSIVRFHGDEERARAVYRGFEPLRAEDVAEAVVWVASQPEHVNVTDLVIMPTAQRNPYLIRREGH